MHAPTQKPVRRLLLLSVFIIAAAVLNVLAWWLPSRPVQVFDGAAAGRSEPLQSVSFAPFRRGQGPLVKIFPTPEQVEEDLASLQGIARAVRTYTSLEGLDIVPAVAGKYGLEVLHSAWLGRELDVNEKEIEALIEQANRHPDTIKRIIVGNEVLLRKDLTADQLIGYIRRVKAAVKQPVSYADVWEFWLQNPRLLAEVDFVTVHFLPYWEDLPVGVDHAMDHILWVYDEVRRQLPGKPVLIGEVGWPSEGRSRRDAVPSRIEAAKFIAAFQKLAHDKGLDYNLVEAFDQPWKVALEGTVGGAWGVLDEFRDPKFPASGRVSNLPYWPLFAGMGLLIALILMVLHAQQLSALAPLPMLASVLFAQMIGGVLGATIEHGLEHNYSLLRFVEFIFMTALQTAFALLLFQELLSRASGREPPTVPLRPLAFSLGELRRHGAACLPFRSRPLSKQGADHDALRRLRLGEWLFAGFALLALYQCIMLAVAGRYRDFPIDYFLLPILGLLVLQLIKVALGVGTGTIFPALGTVFAAVRGRAPGRLTGETVLGFLLLAVPVVVLVVEKISNREAIYWCLTAATYALPLLGNLMIAARDKGIALSAPSR